MYCVVLLMNWFLLVEKLIGKKKLLYVFIYSVWKVLLVGIECWEEVCFCFLVVFVDCRVVGWILCLGVNKWVRRECGWFLGFEVLVCWLVLDVV